jgi:hypothetical protein
MESEIHLGDQILQEYIKGASKDDIFEKLHIDDYIYSAWEKINKVELKKLDLILEKKKLCKTLKINTIPIIDSEFEESDEEHVPSKGQFLKKEPKIIHEFANQINQAMEKKMLESDILVQLSALRTEQNKLQDKINKLIDLDSNNRIGKHEFNKCTSKLNEEMHVIKEKIKQLEDS